MESNTDFAAASVSTSREDWIALALQVLVEEGAAEVKVLTLAKRLHCSRSNFYWFFADRSALMAALLEFWKSRNTAGIVRQAAMPVDRISQGVLNIFECWADLALFDARLDFAVREWARRDPEVDEAVREADRLRLDAVTNMFARFCPERAEAVVRARTLYFTQIGYYALDVPETLAERNALLRDYVTVFSGEEPTEEAIRAFVSRYGPNDV